MSLLGLLFSLLDYRLQRSINQALILREVYMLLGSGIISVKRMNKRRTKSFKCCCYTNNSMKHKLSPVNENSKSCQVRGEQFEHGSAVFKKVSLVSMIYEGHWPDNCLTLLRLEPSAGSEGSSTGLIVKTLKLINCLHCLLFNDWKRICVH